MSRISAIDPANAEGRARDLLAAVDKQLGTTPNMFRVAARAPSVLEGLVGLTGATARGGLKASVREAIALTVAQTNGCDYCLSAHSALGARAGLSPQAVSRARDALADDAKTTAMLQFARHLVWARGRAGNYELGKLREAGVSDAEVLEIIANVVTNIFTNYVNIVADTDIDFPVVRAGG